MADLASLSVQVTTTGVNEAAVGLDKLATSGDKAAKSTVNLNKSFAQGATAPVKEATVAIAGQTAALAKLAGQIDPTIAKLEKLDNLQAQLGKFKASGALGGEDFTTLNTALDASRAKVGAAGEAVSHFTLNNSLARRELGYLAKDLALGNYGRFTQSALTLANASGVMRLAFSGIGVVVLAAVTGIALYAVGAIKGAIESEALRKSVIATGVAAGLTGASFNSTAASIGRATGHFSEARAAINVLAASTKVAGSAVQFLGTAAVNMATVTGLSAEKAAEALIALSKDPTAAVAKLNESYNFLTAAQYAQIAALEDAGRADKASALSQTIASEAFAKRAKEVEDGSGSIIAAAHAVAKEWDLAWNAISGIGRTQNSTQKVASIKDQLDSLRAGGVASDGLATAPVGDDDPRIKALNAKLAVFQKQQIQDSFAANTGAAITQNMQAGIAAQASLAQHKPPKEQLDSTLAEANAKKLAALYGIVDPTAKAKIIGQYNQMVDDANKAYDNATKEKKAKKAPAEKADPFASLNGLVQKAIVFDNGVGQDKADNQQVKDILAIVDAGAKLIAGGKDVAKAQAKVAEGVASVNEGYAKQAAITKGELVIASQQYAAALDKQNQALQESINARIASITMGAKEAAQQQELAAITAKGADALTELTLKRAAAQRKGDDTSGLDTNIKTLQANTDKQVAIAKKGFGDIDAEQAKFSNGVKTAFDNLADEGALAAKNTDTLFTHTFESLNSAIANFAVTGKLSFNSLFQSFLTGLIEIELKAQESKLLNSFGVGSGASAAGGGTGGGLLGSIVSLFSNSGGSSGLFSPYAKGGVVSSPSLSAFSGSIVNKPTTFAFASGAGLMGEAGPEAILPLRRGQDGKLGVSMDSAGGRGGAVSIHQQIVVQGTVNRRTAQQIAQASAKEQRIAQARS